MLVAGSVVACAQLAGLEEPSSSTDANGSAEAGAGTEAVAGVELKPTALAFDTVECGKDAKKTVSIVNRNERPVAYKVQSLEPSFTIPIAASGTVPPKGSITFDVVVKPMAARDIAGDILVDLGSGTQTLTAKVTGAGAMMELAPGVVEFGEVRKENGGPPTTVLVKNTGNRPLNIAAFTRTGATDFSLAPASALIEPDKTASFTASFLAGAVSSVLTASFVPQVGPGACGAAPTLEMRGQRIDTNVTIGLTEWGDVDCNGTPGPRYAVLTNYSTSQITYEASLGAGPFTILDGTGAGTVGPATGAGGSTPTTKDIKIGVVPGSVPGQKEVTLTVLVNKGQANASTRTAKVRAKVNGAVLVMNPASLAFTSDGITIDTKTVNVTNTGTTIYAPTPNTPSDKGGFSAPTPVVFGSGTTVTSVSFKAAAAGTSTGTLSFAPSIFSGTVICSQTTVTLSGVKP